MVNKETTSKHVLSCMLLRNKWIIGMEYPIYPTSVSKDTKLDRI